MQGPLHSLSNPSSLVTGHRDHSYMDPDYCVCLSLSHFLWYWGLNLELGLPGKDLASVPSLWSYSYCLSMFTSSLAFSVSLRMRSYTFSFPISCMAFWSFCGVGVVSSSGEREGSQCQFSKESWKHTNLKGAQAERHTCLLAAPRCDQIPSKDQFWVFWILLWGRNWASLPLVILNG